MIKRKNNFDFYMNIVIKIYLKGKNKVIKYDFIFFAFKVTEIINCFILIIYKSLNVSNIIIKVNEIVQCCFFYKIIEIQKNFFNLS